MLTTMRPAWQHVKFLMFSLKFQNMSGLNIISDWSTCGISWLKHRPGARSKMYFPNSRSWLWPLKWTDNVGQMQSSKASEKHFERKLKCGMSLGNLKVIWFTFVTWKQIHHANKAVALHHEWGLSLFVFPTMHIKMWLISHDRNQRYCSSPNSEHRIEPTTKKSLIPNISSQSTVKTRGKRCSQMLSKLGKLYLPVSF